MDHQWSLTIIVSDLLFDLIVLGSQNFSALKMILELFVVLWRQV